MSELANPAFVQELLGALKDLAAEIGPRAEVSFSLTADSVRPVLISRRKRGDDEFVCIWGDTFEQAISETRAEWAKRSDTHAENTTREMALAIIRITAETGGCTDAQLRGSDFDQADITRFGDGAVARANDMVASGPFTITLAAAANAEAA